LDLLLIVLICNGVAGNLWGIRPPPGDPSIEPYDWSFYAILPGQERLWDIVQQMAQKDFPQKKKTVIDNIFFYLLFIILRIKGYGNLVADGMNIFFDTSKYPPSLQYCCKT
jgi:hypothetical protein